MIGCRPLEVLPPQTRNGCHAGKLIGVCRRNVNGRFAPNAVSGDIDSSIVDMETAFDLTQQGQKASMRHGRSIVLPAPSSQACGTTTTYPKTIGHLHPDINRPSWIGQFTRKCDQQWIRTGF